MAQYNPKNKNDSGLFQSVDVFDDGWQFGDGMKTVLGSTADLGVNVLKGGGRLVEGLTDLIGHGIAGFADLIGQDEWSDKFRSYVNESWVDELASPADEYLDKYSIFGDTGDAIGEGIGQVATIILTGGALGAAGVGSAGISAATTGLMGASSMGSGMSEAYNSGANDSQAFFYGVMKGAIDAGTELLFGGLGKTVNALGISRGLSSLDDIVAKKLSSGISNQFFKNIVQFGVKSSAEGLEEVLAGIGGAVAKKLTYMSDEKLGTLVKDENLFQQFVVGAVSSGITQSGLIPGMKKGSLIDTTKKGQDFVSGLTANEQKVVEKLFKDAVKEKEADGKKLSGFQKNKIYDSIVEQMEQGDIDVGTIEEIIKEDVYNENKTKLDEEDAILKEYDELGKKKSPTLAETTRFNELHEQAKEIKKNSFRKALDSRMSDEVHNRVKGSRLEASYVDRARRGEAYQADVSKYNEAERATIQKAIDAGFLNNTNKTRRLIDWIAKISAKTGVDVDFTNSERLKKSGFAIDGKTINGYKAKNSIGINMQSRKILETVVGHELTHVFEGTELYNEMQKALYDYADAKGELQTRRRVMEDLYKGVEEDIDSELTAELVGDYLFTDQDFINRLANDNRNLFQKIWDEIKYMWSQAHPSSPEAAKLEKLKRAFEKAYQESGKYKKNTAESGVQYSLYAFDDGQRFVSIETDQKLFDGLSIKEQTYLATKIIKERFQGKVIGIDNKVFVNGNTVDEFTHPAKHLDQDVYEAKMRASTELDNLMDAGFGFRNEADGKYGHIHSDAIGGFDYFDVIFKVGSEYYQGVINIKNINRGKLLKDITKIKNITQDMTSRYGSNPSYAFLRDVSIDSISQNSEKSSVFEKKTFGNDVSVPEGDIVAKFSLSADEDIGPARDDVKQRKEERINKAYERIDNKLQQDKIALEEDLATTRANLEQQLADKSAYISNRASELYNELSNLKKGVRASKELGYLLDLGHDWNTLKSTLLKVKKWSSEVVNPNSIEEADIREFLNEEYEDKLYELENLDNHYQEKVSQLEAQAKVEKEEALKAEQRIVRAKLHKGIIDGFKAEFEKNGYVLDEVLKNAKNLHTFSTVDNTPQRVMEKALGYKEGGLLADLTVNKVAQNETAAIKWLNSYTDRKNGLLSQFSKQYNIKPGSKESAAAMMYAEGFYADENRNLIKYGDEELAKDFPDATIQKNIKGLANDKRIRQIYDETLAAINESRVRNGYPEIPRRDNYFLHFRAMEDTFSKMGVPFNPNDIRAKDLPTDLNGVTADLKPGQPFFASSMQRKGNKTTYDLLGGLERYLSSAKNQIYHIDDIQNFRALRNYIADTYGQAKGLEGLDELTTEEVQDRIKKVYGSHLSTFAKFLNEEANILAGKTSLADRSFENTFGRRGITFLDTLNRQVGSNMVGFNVSSSLTNILPVVQAFAKTNKQAFVKGFSQFVSNKFKSFNGDGDGFAEASPVVIRRKGADRFARTPFQKAADAGYFLMGVVDNAATEIIARAKYNELTQKGMDAEQAHIETDKWVSRLMGDRSLGQMPHFYNSKTYGLFTKFQLEVRNQLDSQFYDTIQEAKASVEDIENQQERNAKVAAKVAATFAQLAIAQHIFGQVFESIAGYNPAFDIISVLATLFGFDDEEDSEDTFLDNIGQGFRELLEDLPYTSPFLDGGRIPISSALPIGQLVTGKDKYGNDKPFGETLLEALPYYVAPTGFGQAKKTAKGLSMFSDDLPVAGSYTDSGNLRFPVKEDLASVAQAAVFGQWANENARKYIDDDIAPLNEKQIQEYVDSGMTIEDYWAYREGLKQYSTQKEKIAYINSLDLTDEQKSILIQYLKKKSTTQPTENEGSKWSEDLKDRIDRLDLPTVNWD